MTDYFGFTMAALNENGSVFANPCKGEKNMSTLMYRPFGSWANNSEVKYSSIFFQLSQKQFVFFFTMTVHEASGFHAFM